MNQKKKLGVALAIVPQIIIVKLLGSQPQWVETYYSEGIYPYITQFQRWLFGWIPFSVGDIFYALLAFAFIRYLYLKGKTIWKHPKIFFLDVGVVISVAYFIFHLLWGMNYYRLPINEKLGFTTDYTQDDLVHFCFKMAEKTNNLHQQLTIHKDSAIQIPYSTEEIYQKTLESFAKAAKVFPSLAYETPSLKSSLYSLPLSYMGYGGYLNPFTHEAQVNSKVPSIRLPTISAHEVGHQLGYSSESSTNFIGLLVTSANPDPYLQYAAQSHGLAYCLSNLKRRNIKAFEVVFEKLNSGVKKNYAELNRFWAYYQNPTEPVFKALFNAFLKANNQEKGIKSYHAVVELLIGFDKTKNQIH